MKVPAGPLAKSVPRLVCLANVQQDEDAARATDGNPGETPRAERCESRCLGNDDDLCSVDDRQASWCFVFRRWWWWCGETTSLLTVRAGGTILADVWTQATTFSCCSALKMNNWGTTCTVHEKQKE